MPRVPQISATRSMSHICPYMCTGMIAFVARVIAASTCVPIDAEVVIPHVDKHGPRARRANTVFAVAAKAERRHDHLVARVRCPRASNDRCSAAVPLVDGDGVPDADVSAKADLECRDPRPLRELARSRVPPAPRGARHLQ